MPFAPATLGLDPADFPSWRREQHDAYFRILRSPHRFKVLIKPTGSGKTLTAYASHFAAPGERTLILTANRSLEDVYRDSFSSATIPLLDIRGQQNYVCNAVGVGGKFEHYRELGSSVADAPCRSGIYCQLMQGGCTYYDEVRAAADGSIVSSNYSYWIAIGRAAASGRGAESLGEFDNIVCDEAHSAAEKVREALTVRLRANEIRAVLGFGPLPKSATIGDWRKWADRGASFLQEQSNEVQREIRSIGLTSDNAKMHASIRSLRESLQQLSDMDESTWVLTREHDRSGGEVLRFEPAYAHGQCERLLYRGAKSVVLLSATMQQHALAELDVPAPPKSLFHEYPSSFPVQRRPIYVVMLEPQVRVDRNMSEFDERLWISRIDAIIGPRLQLGRNGIIHCVSYERARRILELSRYSKCLITNWSSNEKTEALRRYRRGNGVALLSPSVKEGEDFPDDECRWILIPKLPFENGTSPVALKRKERDKQSGNYDMMQSLVQSAGRGMRSASDWCEVLILDDHARWALKACREFAPSSFNEALKYVYQIPEPLEVAA